VDVVLLVAAAALVPLAGVLACVDAALSRVSGARAEEMRREGARGADRLGRVIADRARYTNLLLLLRLVAELLATVLVAAVAIDTLGRDLGLAAATVIMVVVSYVLVGVGPRTVGRQHPYRIARATAALVLGLGRIFGPLATLLILV